MVLQTRFITSGGEKRISNFKIRPDDVFIITYPKCGTTWAQELALSIMSNIDPELKEQDMFVRSPFLELEYLMGGQRPEGDDSPAVRCKFDSINYADELKSPRVIKSHLPLNHLPTDLLNQAKVIYVCRDPKDMAVSYYHMISRLELVEGTTLRQFMDLMMSGNVPYGSYFSHLAYHWKPEIRDHPNFKTIWYEEMKEDVNKVIDDLQEFLGRKLTEEKKTELITRSTINSMRERAIANSNTDSAKAGQRQFFRKGIVGDWLNHFQTHKERSDVENWANKGLEGIGVVPYGAEGISKPE